MGQTQQQATLLTRIKLLERALAETRKAATLGQSTISHGGLTVVGDGSITVISADGTELVMNPDGAVGAEFRLIPSADTTNYSSIRSILGPLLNQAEIIIDSGVGATSAKTQFVASGDEMVMITLSADETDYAGGQVAISPTVLLLAQIDGVAGSPQFNGAFVNGTTTTNNIGVIGAPGGDTWFFFNGAAGTTTHSGRWENFLDDGAAQGIYTGESAPGAAGDVSFTLTYGATRASTMIPIVNLFDSSVHPATITAFSTSGFTLTWTTASHAGYQIFFWCYRV